MICVFFTGRKEHSYLRVRDVVEVVSESWGWAAGEVDGLSLLPPLDLPVGVGLGYAVRLVLINDRKYFFRTVELFYFV